ncbi:pacearchaeosortase [Candidatus Pacearchaeota archaeon]|nr:pacearchaeosortase [Candidatus Pacearchaeota archaeon]
MDGKRTMFLGIFARYLIITLVSLPGLYFFYLIFSPLTIYPVYFLLGLLFNVYLQGNVIFIEKIPIEIIGPCIAGSAYSLLFVLNLALPKIKLMRRIAMISFSFLTFILINILRIFLLSILYISGSQWFDFTHKLFWYGLSTVFVIGIWFLEVKIFKIKEMPFYSDLKYLYKKSSLKS